MDIRACQTRRAMSKMLKSSGAMAAATLTSRVRWECFASRLYMYFLGVGWVNDAFCIRLAVRPSLFMRRLLGEGALTAAFIPVFKEKEKLHGETEMWRLANAVISGLVVSMTSIIIVGLALIRDFDRAVDAPIRCEDGTHAAAAACDVSLHDARLRGRGLHGHVERARKIFHSRDGRNDVEHRDDCVRACDLLARIWRGICRRKCACRIRSSRWRPSACSWREWRRRRFNCRRCGRTASVTTGVSPWHDPAVRVVIRRMIPATIGVAAFQINVVTVYILSFWVANGILSSFNGAVRLMEFPQGIFGISLATYLLPTLSGIAAEKNYDEFTLHASSRVAHAHLFKPHRVRATVCAGGADCAAHFSTWKIRRGNDRAGVVSRWYVSRRDW